MKYSFFFRSLHLGIINCKEESVLQLLDVIQSPKCLDIYNDLTQTPLHLAAITRQHRIVEKLIDCGASIDLVDRNGQTCVHLACQRGDLKTLEAIFKRRPRHLDLQEKLQEVLEMKNFEGKILFAETLY
jgi:ankyrin repeat protein